MICLYISVKASGNIDMKVYNNSRYKYTMVSIRNVTTKINMSHAY